MTKKEGLIKKLESLKEPHVPGCSHSIFDTEQLDCTCGVGKYNTTVNSIIAAVSQAETALKEKQAEIDRLKAELVKHEKMNDALSYIGGKFGNPQSWPDESDDPAKPGSPTWCMEQLAALESRVGNHTLDVDNINRIMADMGNRQDDIKRDVGLWQRIGIRTEQKLEALESRVTNLATVVDTHRQLRARWQDETAATLSNMQDGFDKRLDELEKKA